MNKLITISSALLTAAAVKAQTPNIVFILADDLGYGDISAFNPESKIHTPNIDKLAEHGIAFTDAHASSALSTPSRYSLLTGRYPWRTKLKRGGLDGDSPAMIDPERCTIAQMFSANGYNTACIGKWHLGWDWGYPQNAQNKKDVDFSLPIKNGPTERGFDYFYGIPSSLDIAPYVYVENNKVTALPNHIIEPQKGLKLMHGGVAGADFDPQDCLPNIIRHSISYISKQKNSKKPFFLYLPITAPHTPVLPANKYKGKTTIGDYGDFVVMIDDMIQQIIKALQKNGQLDNTIVIFTSDNGCAPYVGVKEMEKQGHFPSYIYRGYKTDIYEGGHRIPLIVSWKGKFSNETNNSLVSLTDFYATFAQMVNHKLKDEEAVDSYSIWPILSKQGASNRKDLVYESGKGYLSLRTPQLKLVFNGGSGGWGYPNKPADLAQLPPMQLFNLKEDPSEKENIIHDKCYEQEVKEMTPRMHTLVEDMYDTMYEAMGVGLAAPQVGILKRIFVVDCGDEEGNSVPYVFINPEIIDREGVQTGYEGCLSVPGKSGMVPRAQKVKVKAFNENMEEFEMEAEGLLARCILHENDHLDGIVYVDKVEGKLYDNSELYPEEEQ